MRRLGDGQYFNGSSFSGSSEVWLSATGTTSWAYTVGPPYDLDADYLLRWRATDAAGNVETPDSGFTFTFDPTLPEAPTALTAEAYGEARVRLSWTPPSMA